MLRSLFGDLAPRRLAGTPHAAESRPGARDSGAMALDLRQRVDTEFGTDVVADASPAEAIRAHFARSRADLDQASAMITLLDPSRLWARQVIAALSEAAARPVERVNLRERGTLRTLAVIERATVPRQDAAPLKVYHADIRATGLEQEEIANALAEGSHLTAVIVGSMPPNAVAALLGSIAMAARQPQWRCPWLVFILPPGSPGLRQRILEQDWPAHVRVAAMSEPLIGASAVWNTVLTAWEAAAAAPAAERGGERGTDEPATTASAELPPLDPQAVHHALRLVSRTDGLLACGIVNLACGDLLATDATDATRAQLARVAAALCAARQAHLAACGPAFGLDELLATMGPHQGLLRALPVTGSMGFVAVVDRVQANLALLRFRLLEAERYLA